MRSQSFHKSADLFLPRFTFLVDLQLSTNQRARSSLHWPGGVVSMSALAAVPSERFLCKGIIRKETR